MSDLYSNSAEEALNLGAIESIAQETHHPVPEVKRVYEAELGRLRAQARITHYLVLLATRRTPEALLRMGA